VFDVVTLVVYGWKSVQPGTLCWVCPSLAAAVQVAQSMPNAIAWAVVAGRKACEQIRAACDLAGVCSDEEVLVRHDA
jgi:hypothetical protein